MKLCLAGAGTNTGQGFLESLFAEYVCMKHPEVLKDKKSMKIHMAGFFGRYQLLLDWLNNEKCEYKKLREEFMKVFWAGHAPWREQGLYDKVINNEGVYVLDSFYYADEWLEKMMPYFGDFMLDSGAFTFISNAKSKVNWEEYVDRYADFINKHDVKKFFELDIDPIVGYDNVLKLRQRLMKATNKQPIPVWHKSRGKDNFLRMCDEFPYVSIGGIVSKEIKINEYKYLPWFISEAHKRKRKIHGLGFTKLKLICRPEYRFDSVDSTSWVSGNQFGAVYRFTGTGIDKIDKPQGHWLKNSHAVAINNFTEWVKLQRYADRFW